MRAAILAVLALGVALVMLSTCVREERIVDRFARRYCEARWECGCGSPGFSEHDCEWHVTHDGDEAQDAAQAAGLVYDRECAKAWLDAIDDSCTVQATPTGPGRCDRPCPPYHGDKQAGEECEEIGPWSDCGRHLVCLSGFCVEPCQTVQPGEDCIDVDVVLPCPAGYTCEGTCVRLPELGDACTSECAPGGMCDRTDDVCVAAPGFGEPCEPERICGRGLRCNDAGVCDVGTATVCVLGTPW